MPPYLPESDSRKSLIWFYVEVLLLAGFFFLVVGGPPPDVNEAHYLTKAKHYWDASFAPQDFFLNSVDAHLAFYWSIGWLTKYCSLTVTAWLGRWLSWILLAGGLTSISRSLGHRCGYGIICGAMFFLLQTNCHLAGEWVVGGLEAKGLAFGFCFFALSCAIRKKWKSVWLLLGAAMAYHVLVGGWITLLLVLYRTVALIKKRSFDMSELTAGVIGLCIGLIGLVPVWGLGGPAEAAVVHQANHISVHVRLPHHLLFSSFQFERLLKFGLLVVGGVLVWWRAAPHVPENLSVLLRLALLSIGLCVTGILLDFGLTADSPLQNSLLRYYWFRTSDVLVPLGAAFGGVSLANALAARGRGMAKALIIATAVMVVWPVWEFQNARFWDPRARGDALGLPQATISDPHRQRAVSLRIERHFLACCQWIRRHTPTEAVVITPVRQQTFKWNALRAEVVTRKDMPQDASGLVDWYNRQVTLYAVRSGRRGLRQQSNDEIASSAKLFTASYLLISQFSVAGEHRFDGDARFIKHFPTEGDHSYYAVYEVRHE